MNEEEEEDEDSDVVKNEDVDEGKIIVLEFGSCGVEEVWSDVGIRSNDEDEDEDVASGSIMELDGIVILGKEEVWRVSVLAGKIDDIDVDETCWLLLLLSLLARVSFVMALLLLLLLLGLLLVPGGL